MDISRPVRRLASLFATAFLISASVTSVTAPVPVSAALADQYYTSYFGEELMRLTNVDRVSLGKPALKSDPFLIALARDTGVVCPSNSALTVAGRSKDMAVRGYFAHAISGCKNKAGADYKVFDMADALGFGGYSVMGENIGYNNYPITQVLYQYGCALGTPSSCKGTDTVGTPLSVSIVESAFMQSSGHRNNILGDYTSFGCASWKVSSASTIYYTCLFSKGTNKPLDTAGPVFTAASGHGVTYAPGATPTFTASVTDAGAPVSDGWVTLDGVKIGEFAHPSVSQTQTMSVTPAAPSHGIHTLVWSSRDAGGNVSTKTVLFNVGSSAPTPPSATFTTPVTGSTGFVGGTANVTWTEANPSGLGYTRSVTESKGKVVTPGTCTGVTWALDWTNAAASPQAVSGLTKSYCYRYAVTLTSAFGSTTVTSGSLIAATPTVTFTAPSGNVTSTASTRKLSWTEYDPTGSGIASRLLSRFYTSLSAAGNCGSTWTASGTTTSASSYAWPLSTNRHCYKWTEKITTRAGFTATTTSPILKRP